MRELAYRSVCICSFAVAFSISPPVPVEIRVENVLHSGGKFHYNSNSCTYARVLRHAYGHVTSTFLGSSTAEHSAVNRRVVGSNPTRGATESHIGGSSRAADFLLGYLGGFFRQRARRYGSIPAPRNPFSRFLSKKFELTTSWRRKSHCRSRAEDAPSRIPSSQARAKSGGSPERRIASEDVVSSNFSGRNREKGLHGAGMEPYRRAPGEKAPASS